MQTPCFIPTQVFLKLKAWKTFHSGTGKNKARHETGVSDSIVPLTKFSSDTIYIDSTSMVWETHTNKRSLIILKGLQERREKRKRALNSSNPWTAHWSTYCSWEDCSHNKCVLSASEHISKSQACSRGGAIASDNPCDTYIGQRNSCSFRMSSRSRVIYLLKYPTEITNCAVAS